MTDKLKRANKYFGQWDIEIPESGSGEINKRGWNILYTHSDEHVIIFSDHRMTNPSLDIYNTEGEYIRSYPDKDKLIPYLVELAEAFPSEPNLMNRLRYELEHQLLGWN